MASERRKRNRACGAHNAAAFVKLVVPIPEEALLAGELELIQAHLAGLLARVFPPEGDAEPHHGDDQPWP